MAILAFQKPEKVIMLESTSSFGKFEIPTAGAWVWYDRR